MRTKNPTFPAGTFEKSEAMASGKYVADIDVGLDGENKRIFNERMAAFAKEQMNILKRDKAQNQPILVDRDELTEIEPQDSDEEADGSEGEIDGSDAEDGESEKENDVNEEEETDKDENEEEDKEQEENAVSERVESPMNAYVPTFEELEEMHQAHREEEQRKRAEQDAIRKKKGKAIAKQTKQIRELNTDPDFQVDAEMVEAEEVTTPKRGNAKKKSEKKGGKPGEEIKDFHAHFDQVGFTNTFYPHEETMKKLGIQNEIEDILACCGIEKFVYMPYPTYPKVATEFLATVKVHDQKDEILAEKYGGGMISFKVGGIGKSLEFKEIDAYFGFKRGEPKHQSIEKDEITRVWKMITGQDSIPKQSKGSSIRNPAINYARRVIAETYYSRRASGPVNSHDLQILTNGFAKLFNLKKNIIGDVAGAGLTFLLCKHLESFRGKAQNLAKKGHKMDKMTVGGTITGLLKLAKVKITADFGEPMPPKFMDIRYLYNHEFLVGPKEGPKFYYRFQSQNTSTATIPLPDPSLTSLDSKKNVTFDPPENLLVDVDTFDPLSDQAIANEAGTSRPSQKKRKVTTTPPGRGSVAKPCVCTQDGYRERIIADLQVQMKKEIAEGIEKGLAELSKNFVRKAELPKAPPLRTSRGLPAHEIPIEQSTERPTVGSTTGPIEQTRVIDSDEDIFKDPEDVIDTIPLKKRFPPIRINTKKPAPKKA